MEQPSRPSLDRALTGAELIRWYWLLAELQDFARSLGVSAAGPKRDLTRRLADVLDGRVPAGPPSRRPAAGPQLGGPLQLDAVIPVGQRSSQALRVFFEQHLGSGFRFDAAMRSFIADNPGRTLRDAVDHWHQTRGVEPAPIAEQFELNRFTRRWHREHPGSSRTELLEAWRLYRSLPSDLRVPP
jgi:hypothetical protein